MTGPASFIPYRTKNPALRILLADDHVLFREGICLLLTREGCNVVAQAAGGDAALRLARELRPDVAVLDLGMKPLNGIETVARIRASTPATQIILLTMREESDLILEALRAGVRGYVLKTQAAAELVIAIREVARGAVYLFPGTPQAVLDAFASGRGLARDPLSGRERQVLQLIAEGMTTAEIAQTLGLSPKTVESHRGRTMQKLEIHEIAGLVRYAIRHQLAKP